MNVRQLDSTDIQARAAKIPCLFRDIDGVTTDCKLYLTPDRRETKAANVRVRWRMRASTKNGVAAAQGLGR